MAEENGKKLITVIHRKKLMKIVLSEGETIHLGSSQKDDIYIEDFKKSQISMRIKDSQLLVKGNKIEDLMTTGIPKDEVQVISRQEKLAALWSDYTGISGKTFSLPFRGIIVIGRTDNNTVKIKDKYVSGHHLTIRCEEGVVHVEDGHKGRASSNGTYINGQLENKAVLQSGDIIDIFHIRIILHNSQLYFENVEGKLSFHDYSESEVSRSDDRTFHRSPRMREQLPTDDIVLKKPPTQQSRSRRTFGGLSSLIGTGAVVGASVAVGTVSPALLAARAASLVAPVSNLVMGHGGGKKDDKKYLKEQKRRLEKYGAYINAQESVIRLVADKQREILTSENPSPETAQEIAINLTSNLWERSPLDSDFLNVRLGMGYEKLCVNVVAPNDGGTFSMEEDDAEGLVEAIIENNRIVDRVPARLNMRRYHTIGLVGNRGKVVDLVRNLLICLTASHFYGDVRVIGIFDKEERQLWEPVRWIPHIWDTENQSRFLAFDIKGAKQLNDYFHDLLQARIKGEVSEYTPHYIFLIGSKVLTENMSMMTELLSNDERTCSTAIFLYRQLNMSSSEQKSWLPKQCQYIVDVDSEYGVCGYDVSQINEKVLITPDKTPDMKAFDRYCRNLSSIEVYTGSGTNTTLPGSLTFLQGMKARNIEDLHVWENWEKHDKGIGKAPIGVIAGDIPFSLDLVKDGPHGLIAGTTGSGKSEFLSSWLLSLAVQYSPEDISFLIIDYKGGGLADTLEGLPHMVGKITNIGNNIQRCMISLNSEMLRRQKLFSDCGVNNYSKYADGFKNGKFSEPLPRLLLVSDEFAELKSQEPEFMAGLIQAARIGRSLGIHLILATQEPNGVVDDQIRSNTNFQVCLKVASTASSRAMINRPDAASIKQPGRAYVRVGTDEIFELVQTYWCGAPYNPGKENAGKRRNMVRLVKLDGRRIKPESEETTLHLSSEKTELEAISEHIAEVVSEHNISKMKCPWLPELPAKLYLTDIFPDNGFDGERWKKSLPWLTIPVGKYDRPELQKQGILCIDFAQEGHYGIYGSSGTGKTNLLKTVLLSLAQWHTPQEVVIYALDFGTWSLKQLEDLPHVGGVALSSEEEKFSKLLTVLRKAFDSRKRLFSKYGISNLQVYREKISDDLPVIILAIDNIVPIFEAYPEYEAILTEIAMQGTSFGIYLVYTANTQTGIRYKIFQNISGNICLEMTDKSDYTNLVGRVGGLTPIAGVTGRGYWKSVAGPVMFQSALYTEGADEGERIENLRRQVSLMNSKWTGIRPQRIPVMPEKIGREEMQQEYKERKLIPVGYSFKTIEPAFLDLTESCGTLLLGKIGSGKSRFLGMIAKILASYKEKNSIYMIDSEREGLKEVSDLAEKYVNCSDAETTGSLLKDIVVQLVERQKRLEASDSGEIDFEKSEEALMCILIDDLVDFTEKVEDRSWNMLRSIVTNGNNLGLIVIAAARSADVSGRINTDPLISKLAAGQNGLAISGTAALYNYYPNHLTLDERTKELEETEAFLFDKGDALKIKLMQE